MNITVNILTARNNIISILAQVPVGLTWVRLAYAATDVNLVNGMRRAKQEQGTHIIKPADVLAVRRGAYLDPIKHQAYASIGYQDNGIELGTAANLKIWFNMPEKDSSTGGAGTGGASTGGATSGAASSGGPLLRGVSPAQATVDGIRANTVSEPPCHCESRYLAAVGHLDSCAYGTYRKKLRMQGAI